MALTEGDKAECKEIAREIIKEVLVYHIENCPHHNAFMIMKAKTFGIIIGCIFASGITSSTVAAIILNIMK